METTKIKWLGNNNYNLNCDIKELEKLGYWNSSYKNDIAPSYISKDKRIHIFFFDLEDEGVKAEKIDYKFSAFNLDKDTEYESDIGLFNNFEDMMKVIKKGQNDKK